MSISLYFARPLKMPLTDRGTIWESLLLSTGFNKIPQRQQVGLVMDDSELLCVQIFWPVVNHVSKEVCRDEIEKFEPTDGFDWVEAKLSEPSTQE